MPHLFARLGAGAAVLVTLSLAACGGRSGLAVASGTTSASGGGGAASVSSGTGAGAAGGSTSASTGTCPSSGSMGAGGSTGSGGTGGAGCPGLPFQYEVVAGFGWPGYSGDNGPATQAQLSDAIAGLARDAAGNLYIADTGNARVRKVDTAGTITTFAGTGESGLSGDGGPATGASVDPSGGLAVDAAGNVYLAEQNNMDIRRVDAHGVISTFAHLPSTPYGIFVDGNGNVFAALQDENRVVRVSPDSALTTVAGTGAAGHSGDGGPATHARLNGPTGVWVDAHGNLFINDSNNDRIRKVDPKGTISTVAGSGFCCFGGDDGPATHAKIQPWDGVAVDAAGEIFIGDAFNNRVRMVDRCGIIHTVAGNGGIQFTIDPGPAVDVGLSSVRYIWLDECGGTVYVDGNASVFRLRR